MRFSDQWLRTWVKLRGDAKVVGERLTMGGLELDQLLPAGHPLPGIHVAKVVNLLAHPEASRLKVCQVSVGEDQPSVQVVCGAQNVRIGMCAPFAAPGTVLPNGQRIEASVIREVPSAGMLCSATELALEEHSPGLLDLGDDAVPGTPVEQVLALNDRVYNIDLTPNRADCLSVLGVARELAALDGLDRSGLDPEYFLETARCGDKRQIALLANEACSRYVGCIIKDVNLGAVSPLWMRERLRRSGQRSINVVVDVLNYVMLELGQPMHAFDLDTLKGDIQVRWGREHEQLMLLDGQTIDRLQDTLVIADDEKPHALAGIMGGLDSAVTEGTRHIFLESAYFDPVAIAGKARSFGLHTESSHRFERGVDPQLQRKGMHRAVGLILELAGGVHGPVCEEVLSDLLPARDRICLSSLEVNQLLGVQFTDAEIQSYLERTGCMVESKAGLLDVTPPSYRFDLTCAVDLIEEVARLYGYDAIETRPIEIGSVKLEPGAQIPVEERIADCMLGLGYQEAIGFSFNDPDKNALFDTTHIPKALSNPISRDFAVMRTSLWPGLCQLLAYNRNRQQETVRLFEIGAKYIPAKGRVHEVPILAGAVYGNRQPTYWAAQNEALSFYDIKGDLASLLGRLGVDEWQARQAQHPGLHPGQSAELVCDQQVIGTLGVLHPQTAQEFGLEREHVLLFEVEIAGLEAYRQADPFRPWSRFPAVKRDIALEVDVDLPVGFLIDLFRRQDVGALQSIELFDVYHGKGLPQGRKSVALGLILQEFSRTLTDKEVEQIVEHFVTQASQQFGAKLRSA